MNRMQTPLLWTLGLLPALAACAMSFVSTSAAQIPQRPKAALAFDQYLVNLRDVPPSRFVAARFHFTNNSDELVTIKTLEPSCGCLTPRMEKKVYQPGETGEFLLQVDTTLQEPGEHEYFVKVNYEGSESESIDLRFKFALGQDKVVLRPKSLIFYQLSPQPTTQEVVITDYRQGLLGVQEIKSFSPFVTAKLDEVRIDAEGNQQLPIKITVSGSIPLGKHQGLLKLKTDDPLYPELTIPLMIIRSDAQFTERPTGTSVN